MNRYERGRKKEKHVCLWKMTWKTTRTVSVERRLIKTENVS